MDITWLAKKNYMEFQIIMSSDQFGPQEFIKDMKRLEAVAK